MSTPRWKDGGVVKLHVKAGIWTVAQMLAEPCMAFFDAFFGEGEESPDIGSAHPLFVCCVARQFLKQSQAARVGLSEPVVDVPQTWISTHPGFMSDVPVRVGKADKTLNLAVGAFGGILVRYDPTSRRYPEPEKLEQLEADDDRVDSMELLGVRVFPELNERLSLSNQLGRVCDPIKDVYFQRKLPAEYDTAIAIASGVRRLEEWGFHL